MSHRSHVKLPAWLPRHGLRWPRRRRVSITFDQAVYGSFPFWNRGYGVLGHSPAVTGEEVAEFVRICRDWGEPAREFQQIRALLAQPLATSRWLVTGVWSPGADDLGRPRALAFHGLFLDERAMGRLGYDPFPFESILRQDWSLDSKLETEKRTIEVGEDSPHLEPEPDVLQAVQAIKSGARWVRAANEPWCEGMRRVWLTLTRTERRTRSLATWAFRDTGQYDLVALPTKIHAGLDFGDGSPGREPGSTKHVARIRASAPR